MKMCCGLFPPLVVFLLVFALSLQSGVAIAAEESGGTQDPLEKVVALNEQALSQLQAGKYEAAREALWGAIAILNDANMGGHEIAARIHVYLAAVYLAGFNDRNKAIRQFVTALKIDPKVTISARIETVALDDAFEAARSQVGLTSQEKETAAVTALAGETPTLPVAEEGVTPASDVSDPWREGSEVVRQRPPRFHPRERQISHHTATSRNHRMRVPTPESMAI